MRRFIGLFISLLVATSTWTTAPASADETSPAVRSLRPPEQASSVREMLRQHEETYAKTHRSALLLQIARQHLELAEGQQALTAYRRFLFEAKNPPIADQREAENWITRLTSILKPLPAPPRQTPSTAS
jgi:hypothetical protein